MNPKYDNIARQLALDFANSGAAIDGGVYHFRTNDIPSRTRTVAVLVVDVPPNFTERPLRKALSEHFVRVVGHAPGSPCTCCNGSGVQ